MSARDVELDEEPVEPETPEDQRSPGSRRALVLVAATLAGLIFGAAIGVLITQAKVSKFSPPATESVDVGFCQDMQVHHLQAVTMAGITRDKTTDTEIHSLAFDIESTQLGQASEMAGWLTVWEQPVLPDPSRGYMAWMAASQGHAHEGPVLPSGGVIRMPGMADTAELNRLKTLSGKELDVFFLQLMLRHHQGAIPMAQYTTDHSGKGYVGDLAKKIIEGQTAEVRLMTAMLAERGAQPLPPPN